MNRFWSTLTSTGWGRPLLNVASSYGYMATVLVTTAVVTPAAIHYLGPHQYGLWAIISQLIGYVMLCDLGLARAMQRLVSESMLPDNKSGPRRYALLWVFSVGMALFLFVIGALAVRYGLRLLSVPPELMHEGTLLFTGLLGMLCLGYCFAPLQGILFAQNRVYISGLTLTLQLVLNSLFFLLFLHLGCGLLSYLYATLIAAPLVLLVPILAVLNGPPRPRFQFSLPAWADVRQVFGFSNWLFLNNLFVQVQMTFPMLLITRFSGLAAAGRFYLGLRLATILYQSICQLVGALAPRWQAMYLENRLERLSYEYSEAMAVVVQLALTTSTCFAVGLKPLLLLWMGSSVYGGFMLTLGMSFYILIYAPQAIVPMPFIWAKALPALCAGVAVEVILGVPICLWIVRTAGGDVMFIAAVAMTALVTLLYYGWRGPRFLNMRHLAQTWTPRDYICHAGQATLWLASLGLVWFLDRINASWTVDFWVGLGISLLAIGFLIFSQWSRLDRIYRERRTSPAVLDAKPA